MWITLLIDRLYKQKLASNKMLPCCGTHLKFSSHVLAEVWLSSCIFARVNTRIRLVCCVTFVIQWWLCIVHEYGPLVISTRIRTRILFRALQIEFINGSWWNVSRHFFCSFQFHSLTNASHTCNSLQFVYYFVIFLLRRRRLWIGWIVEEVGSSLWFSRSFWTSLT